MQKNTDSLFDWRACGLSLLFKSLTHVSLVADLLVNAVMVIKMTVWYIWGNKQFHEK